MSLGGIRSGRDFRAGAALIRVQFEMDNGFVVDGIGLGISIGGIDSIDGIDGIGGIGGIGCFG